MQAPVAVCCSVLRVLQCAAVCCSVLLCVAESCTVLAVCCDVLAVCCSVLQCVAVYCSVLQCVAVCCSVLQSVAQFGHRHGPHTMPDSVFLCAWWVATQHTATHCNTLQHTATHCNTLQHIATHCNTLQFATLGISIYLMSHGTHVFTKWVMAHIYTSYGAHRRMMRHSTLLLITHNATLVYVMTLSYAMFLFT